MAVNEWMRAHMRVTGCSELQAYYAYRALQEFNRRGGR